MPVAGERFWEDGLDEAERALLTGGRGDLVRRPDVLVVGGGIQGIAIALACQRAALGSVQVIEAATLGSGATGGSAGLLLPESHHGVDPPSLVDLARTSLERWRQWHAALPGGVGLVDHDWIGLDPRPAGFAADPPATARRLGADEVAKRAPDLLAPTSGVLVTGQARLNPLRALAQFAQLLDHVATGVQASAVTIDAGRLTSVETTAGTIRPDRVVFATGLPPALDGLDLSLPSDRIKGHLLVTEPAELGFEATVAPLATVLEDGRLLAGGTLDLDDESPAVRAEVIEEIRRTIVDGIARTDDLAVTHGWCCWRPHHPDDLPVVDRLPNLENAWLTSGHYRTGILLAPATAELMVEWIRTSERPNAAAPFGHERF